MGKPTTLKDLIAKIEQDPAYTFIVQVWRMVGAKDDDIIDDGCVFEYQNNQYEGVGYERLSDRQGEDIFLKDGKAIGYMVSGRGGSDLFLANGEVWTCGPEENKDVTRIWRRDGDCNFAAEVPDFSKGGSK